MYSSMFRNIACQNGWKKESNIPDATAFVFTHWKNISFSASTTLECLTSQVSRTKKNQPFSPIVGEVRGWGFSSKIVIFGGK